MSTDNKETKTHLFDKNSNDEHLGGWWATKEQQEAWKNRPEAKLVKLQDEYCKIKSQLLECQEALKVAEKLMNNYMAYGSCDKTNESITEFKYKIRALNYKNQ